MQNPNVVVNLAEKLLSLTLLQPNQNAFVFNVFLSIYLFIALFSVIVFAYSSITSVYEFELSDSLESMLAIVQLLSRIVTLKWNQQHLQRLIQTLKTIWQSDLCKNTEKELAVKINSHIQKLTMAIKCFTAFVCISMYAYLIGLFFDEEKHLVFGGVALRNNYFLYYTIIAMQIPITHMESFIISGFDCCFVGLCFSLLVYFKILNHKLQNSFTRHGCLNQDMKDYVGFNALLRRQVFEMTRMYNSFLLTQFCVSTGACFVEAYLMLESSGGNKGVKSLLFVIPLTLQWSLYCLPAQELTDEAHRVSNSMYYCAWHLNNNRELRKCVYLTIIQSQRPIYFYAGGFVRVSRAAITLVFKQSLSFLTLMRSLKHNNDV